ncbi:MAG: hypothetical protein ABI779_28080 [Acidobacteriota bacterium]
MRNAILLLCLVLAVSANAAEVAAGAQHVLALSTGEERFDGGKVTFEPGRGFAAFVDVFWSERFSTRAAATFVNPAVILFADATPPGDVDLGTMGLDIYAATARIHFASRSRFSAFAGAGGALVVIGNLEDRFGDDLDLQFDPKMTFVAEGGVRYRIAPRITLELGAAWLPLEVEPDIRKANDPRIPIPSTVSVDPLIVSAGASWRF